MKQLDTHFPLTNTQRIISAQNAASHGDSALKFIAAGNDRWARLHARAAYTEAYRSVYGIPDFKMTNPDAYNGVTDEGEDREPVPDKSAKHIAFAKSTDGVTWEFYVVGEDIHRAPVDSPVMPDGRRSGRFEYPNREPFLAYLSDGWNGISFQNEWSTK